MTYLDATKSEGANPQQRHGPAAPVTECETLLLVTTDNSLALGSRSEAAGTCRCDGEQAAPGGAAPETSEAPATNSLLSRGGGMSGHQSARAQKHEWLTPPALIKALGTFDLDPCAPVLRPWDMARHHYTLQDDGLGRRWSGRVWLNPPYGQATGEWLGRLVEHGDGIALIFARTETEDWMRHVWRKADAILFIHGRLYFHHASGIRAAANSGAPSALIAYGQNNVRALRDSGIAGSLVSDWRATEGACVTVSPEELGTKLPGESGPPDGHPRRDSTNQVHHD